ncbi:methyl-accepting chemotaxis protein [Clostridium sp.]|uniref:methyl-accepting chemotaxis protein n=1 Tax=Clostridium sp. TaxID=1506 RepID=UPI0026396D38|nr:methyl-accepting chemotaxis protein [Clostridium sp.]
MLRNMKLSSRIIGGFILVSIITLMVGMCGWYGIVQLTEHIKEVGQVRMPSIDALLQVEVQQNKVLTAERGIINKELSSTKDLRTAHYTYMDNALSDGDAAWKVYEPLPQTKEESELVSKFLPQWDTWKKKHQAVIDITKQIDRLLDSGVDINDKQISALYDQANAASLDARQSFLDSQNTLVQIIKLNEDVGKQSTLDSGQDTAFATISSIVVLIIGVIAALACGIFLSRSISKPLHFAVESLNEGAEQIAAASEQLSGSSQQLAEANSEQASSIEETAATLEEATSMIQQNNENTRQASILAGEAKTSADNGSTDMREMMEAMTQIKKSSDEISKIIKVVDEIAFQTNILALNAAVEAARAGDAGMGFAVVAEEVRNLAQRSAQAAKDTAAIIETNISLSEKGVIVAEKVSKSLEEITVEANKVKELMDEVSAASQEQAQGISQINKAMSQMEIATQQNATTAEESASASEQLSAQTENLREVVHQLISIVEGQAAINGNIQKIKKPQDIGNKMKGSASLNSRNTNKYFSTGGKVQLQTSGKSTRIVNPNDIIPLDEDTANF